MLPVSQMMYCTCLEAGRTEDSTLPVPKGLVPSRHPLLLKSWECAHETIESWHFRIVGP